MNQLSLNAQLMKVGLVKNRNKNPKHLSFPPLTRQKQLLKQHPVKM